MRSLLYYYLNALATLVAANMFVYGLVILRERFSDSHNFTSVLFFGVYGPSLVISLYAGSLLDRINRKGILVVGQAVFALLTIVLGLLLWSERLNPGNALVLLPLLAFGAGIAQSFVIPARLALLGNLTSQERIGGATLILNILVIAGFGVAPALAGWVRQRFPFHTLFFVTSGLFLGAILLLMLVRPSPVTPRSDKHNVYKSLAEGFRFILRKATVFELLVLTFFGLLMVGPIQTLIPNFAKLELDLDEFGRGLVLGMLGAGLLVGGIVAGFVRNRRRGMWIIASVMLVGMFSAALSAVHNARAAGVVLAQIGFFGGIMATLLPAAIQSLTPDHVRGRVMGVYTLTFQGTPAISALILGGMAQVAGIRWAIFLAAVGVSTAAIGATFLLPRVRNLD